MKTEIIRLTRDLSHYFGPATELVRATEGRGAISDRHIENYSMHPQCIAVAALSGEKLIGIATAGGPVPDTGALTSLLEEGMRSRFQNARLGFLKVNSVAPEHRGLGIGTQLTLKRLEFLKAAGCDHAYAISWINGGPQISSAVFEKLKFEKLRTIPYFYRDALRSAGESCLICEAECACSAGIFVKAL